MIVDDVWVSVGSTNFDSRSFRLNDEASLNVLDRDLARALTSDFEADRARARRVSLEEWRRRPASEKLVERAAGLLRSQL
jgi:cardiolipin synthase A/B